jgi:hypothetical protein
VCVLRRRCDFCRLTIHEIIYFFFNSLEIVDCICKYYYFNTCVSPLFTIPVLQSSNFIKCSRNFGFTGQCFESSFLPIWQKVFEFAAHKISFIKDNFVLQRFLYSWVAFEKLMRPPRHRRLGISKGSCFCAERWHFCQKLLWNISPWICDFLRNMTLTNTTHVTFFSSLNMA